MTETTTPAREMPRYTSHKTVRALQIDSVDKDVLTFVDKRFPPITVDPKMFTRYTPVKGDYYVVYDDGYASISPKVPFEQGYSLGDHPKVNLLGVAPAPVPKHENIGADYPKWIEPHPSQVHTDANGHVSTPDFPLFHIERSMGKVTVYVDDADAEKRALEPVQEHQPDFTQDGVKIDEGDPPGAAPAVQVPDKPGTASVVAPPSQSGAGGDPLTGASAAKGPEAPTA